MFRTHTMSRVITIFACFLFASAANADIHVYTFTGQIPDGASQHPMIADGETWTAVMGLDIDTEDTNFDPEFGVYTGAVRFGSLTFSGGYDPNIDLSLGDAFILDNVGFSDSVRVRGVGYTFQVNNEMLDTFSGDGFLDPGTVITPFDDPAQLEFFQLTMIDDLGMVSYLANQTNNVSLSVSVAVPEPATASILIGLLFGAVCRRRRTS